MPRTGSVIVILGTGGTISALADSPDENVRYRVGKVGVAALAAAVPESRGIKVENEQVAQLDSKDMDFVTWRRLAERVSWHVSRPEVRAVVVTHGTDTLEETAWFLQRVLAPTKPVVITGAMRPASSAESDGARNLAEAVTVATVRSRGGVVVSFAGSVHGARAVRKLHPTRLDPFTGGDADEDTDAGIGLIALPQEPSPWPLVAIVSSTAAADARSVSALVDAGFNGIVVAATGNGAVHHALEAALETAVASGVAVLRATRCLEGAIVDGRTAGQDDLPSAGDLTPQKARVELIVRLLERWIRRRRG